METEKDTIYSLFHRQVEKHPDALAVMDDRRQLTFLELERLVDTVASRFLCNRPSFIGIVMDHNVEFIASILAAVKVGAAYVPAEPGFPVERIRYMMKECDVDFLITHEKYAGHINNGFRKLLIEEGQVIRKDVHIDDMSRADGLAYVLYTSGTSGEPKGVKVLNRNVCHYVRAFQHEFHPEVGDRMLQHSVCSFDIFVEEMFTTLLSGAALCIPNEQTKADIHQLMAYVEANQITEISGFPYLLLEMNKLDTIPSSLRLIISGGDVLRGKYVTRLLDKALVYNTYGPSETTVCASYYRCNGGYTLDDGTYPIGKPVLGVEMAVMDDEGRPLPQGETGEIYIYGNGVSQGYVGSKPEQANFSMDETRGSFYKSGDLGYVLPDGNVAFVHRKDNQVMILGMRVECDEVENLLNTCSEVEKAVVSAYTDSNRLSYLVAYIVPRDEAKFDYHELRRKLSMYLTPFMVPEFFVKMQALPMTPNGKVDRKALPVVLKEWNL
ncbi:amino acid adenylation domain-containing protein [Prevotella sp. KH2C16]|uniref:amino acid adenylation domain-containing protein n=1 Tax=Prevotella sp. KH2C16 TaxID=1855325 RepID=UPI0008F02573|nr:amino acid adenylation domain-containing protein [Prevotella sp. KH2C16]SFG27233.1 amino acid adenylation domain-containing protein [Prevotella sp. KH2C16]